MKEKIAVQCHNEEEFNAVKMLANPDYWRDVEWATSIGNNSPCIYLSEITGWDRKKHCIENGYTVITAEEYLKRRDGVRSLLDIYNEKEPKDGEVIKVLQRIPCGDRADTFCLISIDEKTDTAFGYYEKRENNLIRRTASKKQWLLWTPPEPVPHWTALKKEKYSPVPITSRGVYPSDESARKVMGSDFIRLVKECPPVMITPEED